MTRMRRRDLLKGMGAGAMLAAVGAGAETTAETVFELRVYTAAEGKLEELLARFRDHTIAIFDRHGMKSVAYWKTSGLPPKSAEGQDADLHSEASEPGGRGGELEGIS